MKTDSAKPSKQSPLRWYDAILLRVIPPLVALLVKLILLSCRVIKVEGKKWEEAGQEGVRLVSEKKDRKVRERGRESEAKTVNIL